MIALWIILGIIVALVVVIFILLHISIRGYLEADNKHFGLEIRYLGFKLYRLDLPDKSEKENEDNKKTDEDSPLVELGEIGADESEEKDSSKNAKTDDDSGGEESDNTSNEDENKSAKVSLLDKFNALKIYIPAGKKAFRKLLKLIRFYDLKLSIAVGDDDPYKAGLNFGRINAVVYNFIGLICCLFSVKIKSTDIKCDFEKKELNFFLKTTVYIRPSALIALAIYCGFYYLKIKKTLKNLENTEKEKANNE